MCAVFFTAAFYGSFKISEQFCVLHIAVMDCFSYTKEIKQPGQTV